MQMRPETLVSLLERVDALRRPQRFEQLMAICICDALGRTGFEDRPYPQAERLRKALEACTRIDAAAIAKGVADKRRIAEAIHAARCDAVKTALASTR